MKIQDTDAFTYSQASSQEETQVVRDGLTRYNERQTNGAIHDPGIEINLVLRGAEDQVIGGISASTGLRVMYLEALWVAEEYRKLGYGRELVLAAERVGHAAGCIASHTYTFSWQAPGFYQKLGYRVLGIYDGYPDGITEYVLMKRLLNRMPVAGGGQRADHERVDSFAITEPAAAEEMEIVHSGLGHYVCQQIGDKRNDPGIKIQLLAKDCRGRIVGGLLGGTTIRNMCLDHLWVDERNRGQGHGTRLMLEADRIAQESGCIACQTYCLSFQAPEFFRKLGYETYGISDGYPDPYQERYLIKRYRRS